MTRATMGLVALVIAGAVGLCLTGCATGRPPATPLHRASTAAVVLVEAGTLAHEVITARIEADLIAVRASCEAPCIDAVRARAAEYAPVVAAHALYAGVVNELVAELAAQARRQQAGDDVDLGDALRLAGRALTVYRALAETLRAAGIEAPAIPMGAVAALAGEVAP